VFDGGGGYDFSERRGFVWRIKVLGRKSLVRGRIFVMSP